MFMTCITLFNDKFLHATLRLERKGHVLARLGVLHGVRLHTPHKCRAYRMRKIDNKLERTRIKTTIKQEVKIGRERRDVIGASRGRGVLTTINIQINIA